MNPRLCSGNVTPCYSSVSFREDSQTACVAGVELQRAPGDRTKT